MGDSLTLFKNIAGQEIAIAFPFIDTLQSGLLITTSAKEHTDTIPAFFYKSKKNLDNPQRKQLYDYMLARTKRDTVALFAIE